MALGHSPKIVANGLVLCLDAGNKKSYSGTGNTWIDISANGNNANLLNNVSFSANNLFSFNGTNNAMTCASNCEITGSVTLIAVVRPLYSNGAHKTIICTDTTHTKGVKLMNYKNSARYGLWVGLGAGAYEAFVATNINDGTIKMLTGVWDQTANAVVMYINGEQTGNIATPNTSTTQLADGIIKIGTDYWSDANGLRYEGDIYYTCVYNRALSATEVRQNFIALRRRFGL